MNTMKRILTAALVATSLAAGLGAWIDVRTPSGCKPEIQPRSAELAGNFWNKRERNHRGTAVMAVRG